jgi:4-hydroxy-4-methyl-2-oxoglutarate aldolase
MSVLRFVEDGQECPSYLCMPADILYSLATSEKPMSATALTPADLEQLRAFDTPTVCNVVELFDLCPRTAFYMDGRIKACFPSLPPIVGYAATATYRSAAPPHRGNVYSGLAEQVEAFAELAGPAVVVFQDLDEPTVSATFGEVMCTTYKAFGAVGLITSGAARDLDQVRALNFPCFANSTICAHGYCHIVQINVAVRVGGLTVHAGDLLHGDCNGVARIPTHLAKAVADACPELAAAEAVVLDYLRSGKVTKESFAAARQESQRRIETLGKKLRSLVGSH